MEISWFQLRCNHPPSPLCCPSPPTQTRTASRSTTPPRPRPPSTTASPRPSTPPTTASTSTVSAPTAALPHAHPRQSTTTRTTRPSFSMPRTSTRRSGASFPRYIKSPRIARRSFVPQFRIYKVWDKPVGQSCQLHFLQRLFTVAGPHTRAMFEVNTFDPHQTGTLFCWLVANRGPCP